MPFTTKLQGGGGLIIGYIDLLTGKWAYNWGCKRLFSLCEQECVTKRSGYV